MKQLKGEPSIKLASKQRHDWQGISNQKSNDRTNTQCCCKGAMSFVAVCATGYKVIFYVFFCFLKLKRYLLKYRLCGMISSSSTAHHIMLSTFDMLLRKRSRRHCFPQASGQGTNICKYTGCVSPLISILSQYRLMCSLPPEFYNVVKLISHQMQLSYFLCIFMRSIYYESQDLYCKTLHFTYWYKVV